MKSTLNKTKVKFELLRCDFVYITADNRSCTEIKAQYTLTRLTCHDTDLTTFKAFGKLPTKQLNFSVSGINYLVKAKINLKNEAKPLNSIYELRILYEKTNKTYTFNFSNVRSYDVWFNEPLAINSKDDIVNVWLHLPGENILMVKAHESIILYGIPVIRNCSNTNCLSQFKILKHLVHNSNPTECVEDSDMLELRFNACIGKFTNLMLFHC